MNNSNFATPSENARKVALNHPNGYVYAIDEQYENEENVPPEAIMGCWKVDKQGLIEGDFIYNPNYKQK